MTKLTNPVSTQQSVVPGRLIVSALSLGLSLVLSLGLTLPASGQSREIRPDESEASEMRKDARISLETGFPVTVFGISYRPAPSDPESMAMEYLTARQGFLGLDPDQVRHVVTRETPGGFKVRYEQVVGGYPVFQSDIVVSIARDGRVDFVTNGFRPRIKIRGLAAKTDGAVAVDEVRRYLNVRTRPQAEALSTVIYHRAGRSRLAHRVEVVARESIAGDWDVLVDAGSGEIFRAVNRAHGHRAPLSGEPRDVPLDTSDHERAENAQTDSPKTAVLSSVPGTAWVFDPDPLSSARQTYGGDYSDNDDSDNQALTDQLVQVTLPDITMDTVTGTYSLEGQYVRISDHDMPNDGVFSQASSEFHFTRGQDAFEAVNAYYHIDKSMRYINETLGFTLMPTQYTGGLLVDPHGADGDDQSYYSGGDGALSFGEGGVDDAEDADVLLHELGHGLHDWVTNGGLSQVDGLSEGSGDYWANSYHRSLDKWTVGEDQRSWVFHWDGHNEFFSGRTTDYGARYPDGLIDQIHTDGQIWASSLMEIWEQIGRETTDGLFLEALSRTGSTSSQTDAALAFISAAEDLNDATTSEVIRDVFQRRGYLIRAGFDVSSTAGPPPLNATFSDESFAIGGSVDSWAWDFDNDGVIDSNDQNPTHTYTEPGLHTVSLTIAAGSSQVTVTKEDYISVNQGVYIWQGGSQAFERSGDFIRNHLLLRQVPNAYAGSAAMHEPLTGYDAVFLSLGNYDAGNTELGAGTANTLRAFIQSGGRVFLDGSEALGWDQRDNAVFLSVFGIQAADDGPEGSVPVTNLQGQSGSIMEGMSFTGSSQFGNGYIDTFTPTTSGVAAFTQGGLTYAVQNETSAGGKTFTMSYSLSLLNDGDHPSTREEVMDRVLAWFDIAVPTGTEEADLPGSFDLQTVYPNPFADRATATYELPRASPVTLSLYDALGRRVLVLADEPMSNAGRFEVGIDGQGLPSGTYFLRMEAGSFRAGQAVIVLR